jgi:hypothetical protein
LIKVKDMYMHLCSLLLFTMIWQATLSIGACADTTANRAHLLTQALEYEDRIRASHVQDHQLHSRDAAAPP